MTSKIKVPNRFPLVNDPTKPRIAIVGEAPGADEVRLGIPFVGYSGQILDSCLQKCEILRNGCFIGNVHQYQPFNNDIDTVNKAAPEWAEGLATLKADLETYKPDVILVLGETAMFHLTGRHSITKWRGSILPCTLVPGLKVVPAYHPAFVLRQYSWFPILQFDIQRAKEEASIKGIILPQRTYKVNPTFDEVMQHLSDFLKVEKVAFDFETLRDNGLPLCLGFAPSATYAICIPFGACWTTKEEAEIWRAIERLLRSPVKKIAQNYLFDATVAAVHMGILIKNLHMDTMLAWHACYPELPKKLSFISSILTKEPYYKHEHKESEEEDDEKGWASSTAKDKLYIYNCKDCAVTYEIAEKLEAEMRDMKAVEGYKIDMSLLQIAMYMTLRGIRVDAEENKKLFDKLTKDIEITDQVIAKLFGRPVNVKSPKDMKALLYDELKLPKIYSRGANGTHLSADADALIELSRKFSGGDLRILLKARQMRTRQAFFSMEASGKPEDCYKDGRIHPGFNIAGTETGRWSSSSSILGGRNIMNIPEDCRSIYTADPGKVLIGWDKAQAEARVVAYKAFVSTGDSSYKDLIEGSQKIHVWFGRNLAERRVFKCHPDEIKSGTTEYYISKVGVHANSYGMGPIRFCKMVAKETDGEIIVEPATAKQIKEALYDSIPAIPLWQAEVRKHLSKSRIMQTAFFRSRVFFERWGDDLFGEAYAFEPQSTVADDVALSILRCEERIPGLELLQQNYDSMLGQVEEAEAGAAIETMRQLVSQPITVYSFDMSRSISFSIPVVFKVGKNWRDMQEVK